MTVREWGEKLLSLTEAQDFEVVVNCCGKLIYLVGVDIDYMSKIVKLEDIGI